MPNDLHNLLLELQIADKAVGSKQVLKAISQGKASRVFLAKDVDHFLSQSIINAAQLANVPLTIVESREELAKFCNVSVKTAAAAICKQ